MHPIGDGEEDRPRTAGPFGRLALSAGALVALAIVMEVALRVAAMAERRGLRARYPGRGACTRVAENPDLVWEGVPGACGQNARGYLDFEHDPRKPAGAWRLVVVGDSVAAGQGVRFHESFPRRLEASLRGGRPREVVVLAQSGYSLSQEIALLRDGALDGAPDVLVWSYVPNDPAHPVFHDASGDLGVFYYRPASRLFALVGRFAFLAKERLRARDCPLEFHARLHCAYRDEIEAHLREVGERARAAGVPAILLSNPVLDVPSFDDPRFAPLSADLERMATASGLLWLDGREGFRGEIPENIRLGGASRRPPDPWHPNARGHSLVAEALRVFLIRNGLVDPPPARGDGDDMALELQACPGEYARVDGLETVTLERDGLRLSVTSRSHGRSKVSRGQEGGWESEEGGVRIWCHVDAFGSARRLTVERGGESRLFVRK